MGLWDSISGFGNSLMGGLNTIGQGISNAGGGIMNAFSGFGGGGGNGGGRPNVSQGGGWGGGQQGGGFMNQMFQNPSAGMGGLGIMGLGQMMNKKTSMPNPYEDQSVQQLMNWNNSASHPMDPNVQQAMQNSLNIQNEQQLRNLRDTYKNLRPGTDYTTDSAYQRDLSNLNRTMATQGADAMAGAQFQSNQQQIGNLSNMANLGVGTKMGQAGLDAQRQQQQNEMFGNLGSMFLQKGIGQPDYSGILDAFMKGRK